MQINPYYLKFSLVQCTITLLFTLTTTFFYLDALFFFSIITIAIGSVFISYFLYAWNFQNMLFYQTFNLSIGLSALLYFLGYLFAVLQPLFI